MQFCFIRYQFCGKYVHFFVSLHQTPTDMTQMITYNCANINSQRLYISNLSEFFGDDASVLHFIKGTIICFCRRGSATIKVNYTTYTLDSNSLLAILPTHVISIVQTTDEAVVEAVLYSDEYWASLSHSIDYQLIRMVEHVPFIQLPPDYRQEAYCLLDLIQKHDSAEATAQRPDVEHSVAGGLAFSLLMLLVSMVNAAGPKKPMMASRKEMLTHDFFELLAQHYETERQVAFYASKLCVTPKHLSTMVKEVTHQPILDWINNVTVLNIKQHLLTSTDTIQQISEDLNFQTPSTFVRYFRQHTGMTPAKYRASQTRR
jgi:AraC-like DNA-binding protein